MPAGDALARTRSRTRVASSGCRRRWLSESPREMDFEEWALKEWLPHCDYWHVPDLVDAVLHDLAPRRVSAVREPTPATGSMGSIEVHTSALEPVFMFGAADHLLPAIKRAPQSLSRAVSTVRNRL